MIGSGNTNDGGDSFGTVRFRVSRLSRLSWVKRLLLGYYR
jgi:hypothetical protein